MWRLSISDQRAKFFQVHTVSNLQKGYITNHENQPTHHHMKHGNWWYSHLLEDLLLRSNHKTWQHKEDRLVLVRNTYKEKRRQRLSTSQPSFRNYLA
uniref:Putative ovule protein n=1 Tax=Solanum chacoense TaxID=4108 RepID=A0A0V0H974_SOLCH